MINFKSLSICSFNLLTNSAWGSFSIFFLISAQSSSDIFSGLSGLKIVGIPVMGSAKTMWFFTFAKTTFFVSKTLFVAISFDTISLAFFISCFFSSSSPKAKLPPNIPKANFISLSFTPAKLCKSECKILLP